MQPPQRRPAPRRPAPGLYPLVMMLLAANLSLRWLPASSLPWRWLVLLHGITAALTMLLIGLSFVRLPPRHGPLWLVVAASLLWLALLIALHGRARLGLDWGV
ncbi:hypothetical protein [Alloalcanivorax gelatiniphagus]|uniref:DUF2306 domain-containing protein n=1 Tax=Alloalcanivorax gelatiniphagus TaxID=1194167 RepID=A0ABY2XLU3_9GAMM|nr:hypothetical protein [Alloalcanivorax gelatiniphagus]TMW13211.1 hypothetical protein FGS76_07745 [Alloalcanivorax gelatiniphagus]